MACVQVDPNVTFDPRNHTADTVSNFIHLRHIVYDVIIPTICIIGLAGNLTNLYVFGKRWCQQGVHALEKASLAGLIALSLSDLYFCFVAFPSAFLHQFASPYGDSPIVTVAYYYSTYKRALLNLAIFSSTWCIVVISLARYVAVCHPFSARWFIRWWKTVLTHLGIFLCSVLITLPEFLRFRVNSSECSPGCICRYMEPRAQFVQPAFKTAYGVLWSTVGTLIPLALLAFFNIRLLVEIYRSKTQGLTDPDRYCSSRLTMTVVGIITLFLILVCPSMILTLLEPLIVGNRGHNSHGLDGMGGFRVAVLVTNLLQAMKFASNFLLYVAINRQFRETLTCAIRKPSWNRSRTTSDSPNKVEMTTVKL